LLEETVYSLVLVILEAAAEEQELLEETELFLHTVAEVLDLLALLQDHL
jgi:hypothetical protein